MIATLAKQLLQEDVHTSTELKSTFITGTIGRHLWLVNKYIQVITSYMPRAFPCQKVVNKWYNKI